MHVSSGRAIKYPFQRKSRNTYTFMKYENRHKFIELVNGSLLTRNPATPHLLMFPTPRLKKTSPRNNFPLLMKPVETIFPSQNTWQLLFSLYLSHANGHYFVTLLLSLWHNQLTSITMLQCHNLLTLLRNIN